MKLEAEAALMLREIFSVPLPVLVASLIDLCKVVFKSAFRRMRLPCTLRSKRVFLLRLIAPLYLLSLLGGLESYVLCRPGLRAPTDSKSLFIGFLLDEA